MGWNLTFACFHQKGRRIPCWIIIDYTAVEVRQIKCWLFCNCCRPFPYPWTESHLACCIFQVMSVWACVNCDKLPYLASFIMIIPLYLETLHQTYTTCKVCQMYWVFTQVGMMCNLIWLDLHTLCFGERRVLYSLPGTSTLNIKSKLVT